MKTILTILYILGFVGTYIYQRNGNSWTECHERHWGDVILAFVFALLFPITIFIDMILGNIKPPKWLVLIFVLGWMGCSPQKPFIIINKFIENDSKITRYTYQCSDGVQHSFTDWTDKYNIGDTLK